MSAAPWPVLGPEFAGQLESRTPVGFEHGLAGDPRFTLDAIARLGDELGPDSISAERAAKPLVSADAGAASALRVESVGEQILGLAANDSWFTLLNIENSRTYHDLVDQVVDGIGRSGGIAPATLRRRMGFVFASSPGSVTAAHFDIEHSFLFQLEGARTLHFGRFGDQAERDREVHRYWNGSFGRLEQMPEQTREIDLGPGRGAYIPPYTPHWLVNGDNTSLSLTVTFFERSNESESMVQAFNEKLRRVGVDARRYGESPARDRAKTAFMRSYGAVKGLVRPETSASH